LQVPDACDDLIPKHLPMLARIGPGVFAHHPPQQIVLLFTGGAVLAGDDLRE
jgi:hypothetical protein